MICLNTITNFLSEGKNRTVGGDLFFHTDNNFSRSCKKNGTEFKFVFSNILSIY